MSKKYFDQNSVSIKKEIKIFGWASFLNDLGSDMIYPLWPMFVKSLGADMAILGFLDGLGDALVSLSQAFSGWLADKIKKRKIFVWLGYFFGSLSRIGYAFSLTWHYLIPFRILDRAGKIRSAPRDAIVADLSSDKNRGRNFGFLRTMDNLGATLGILVTLFLFNFWGYKKLFLLAAFPSLISCLLVILFIKETKKSQKKLFKEVAFEGWSKNLKFFVFISALFSLGSFSYSFLLIASQNNGWLTATAPFLYLVFTLSATFSSLPFGRLADKIGRKAVLEIAYFLWGTLCLLFIFLPNRWTTLFSFIIYGLHKGSLEPSQKALVAELAPLTKRASVLGGFQMVVGLLSLPASFLAGILWEKINPQAPFYFSFLLTLTSLFLLSFLKKEVKND